MKTRLRRCHCEPGLTGAAILQQMEMDRHVASLLAMTIGGGA